jgi:hypothetical protein
MKLETYLNAMEMATVHAIDLGEYADSELYEKRQRQYRAFRDRILRLFEELEYEVLEKEMVIAKQKTFIAMKEWEEKHS